MPRITTQGANAWIQQGKIPLGYNEDGDYVVFKMMPRVSDFIVVAAMTGRGKSVVLRNIYYFIQKTRPLIVIDWEGEDHKHSIGANTKTPNIPPYTKPEGIKALYLKYPAKNIRSTASIKLPHEQEVTPSLNTYIAQELRGMGFPEGGAMELKRIIREYGQFKDFQHLQKFLREFPTNERTSQRAAKEGIVNDGDTLPSQTKQSILKHLDYIAENRLFTLVEQQDNPILKQLAFNGSVFCNFSGNVDLARVELSKIIDLTINYLKKYPTARPPYFIFEEADRLFPRYFIDTHEKAKAEYVLNEAVQSILRARKLRIGMAFCTPRLSNLHKDVVDSSYEYIFGEMKGYDRVEARRLCGDMMEYLIKELKFNRYTGIREFLYYNEFRKIWKFIPFVCPQAYHVEGGG